MRRTGGVFQPLVGAVLVSWGYRKSLLERPASTETSPGDQPVTGEFELDMIAGTVRIPLQAQLDLGGIAKGWMAQRLADMLADRCEDETILVDAGGDLASARGDHIVAVERPGVSLPNREACRQEKPLYVSRSARARESPPRVPGAGDG